MDLLPQTGHLKTEKDEYIVPEGRNEAIEYLIKRFPHEEKGIKAYFKAMNELSRTIRRLSPDMGFLSWHLFLNRINQMVFRLLVFTQGKEQRCGCGRIFEHKGQYYAYGFAYQNRAGRNEVNEQNLDLSLRNRLQQEVVFLYDIKFNPQNGTWMAVRFIVFLMENIFILFPAN